MKTAEILKKLLRTTLLTAMISMIAASAYAQDEDNEYRLKEIVVVATKDPSPAQETASSISAFGREMIEDSGINLIGDLAAYVPNTNMVEFSERILSQPYFRGIGSGPNNPAVTTYIDGVPQLHGYSANIQLLDIRQIEFVRGAQGTLYGRNTVGGVMHILSRYPNLTRWEYDIEGGYGSYDLMQSRFRISGPLVEEKIGISFSVGYSSRDGYTENDITGNDIDSREALYSKLQLEWLPNDDWSARLFLFAERDRDGDYALHDLMALRANPYHVQRDFEGYLDRDIFAPTLALEYSGDKVDFLSITGFVNWETKGITDLDYTPYASNTRSQNIRDSQVTQEFQLRSAESAEITLNDNMKMAWQTGVLFFMQDYHETSVNNLEVPFPISMTSPVAKLHDKGVGAYAQSTLTAWNVWDFSMGMRFDYEKKDADLRTFYTPPIADRTSLNTDRDFTEMTPQFSISHRIAPGKMVYGSISSGYRAGGFNPVSPSGREDYDEETSLNYETGVKTTWLEERLQVNLATFYIAWDHMQLNLPYGQTYYIDNAGDAGSAGVELEVTARLLRNWEIFGSTGYTRAQFGSGSTSIHTDELGINTEININGNDLIYTPEFTASAGTQYSWELGPDSSLFLRTEITGTGEFFYNTANTESQDTHWISDLCAGYKTRGWFIEAWVKNLFDKEYIPVAFEFPNGQSGFVGENGAPRTIGVRAGFNF